MPSAFDPPTGIIATANGRITPDGYPFQLGIEWVSGDRAPSVFIVSCARTRNSPRRTCLPLQTDVTSPYDTMLAQRFVYTIDHNKGASDKARKAADVIRTWNGKVEANSATPTIIARSRRELQRMMLEPKLGGTPDNLLRQLAGEPIAGRWKMSGWKTLLRAKTRLAASNSNRSMIFSLQPSSKRLTQRACRVI